MFDEMPERVDSLIVKMNWWNTFSIRRILKNYLQVVIFVGFILFSSFGVSSERTVELQRECQIPAIYNFGDSNSDTGSVSAAFGRVPYPNGITFFGRPSGRYCDGRLLIDFIAEKLGLPHLSAYLDALDANFQHGANFAAGGTTIQHVNGKMYESGINPLSLDVQLLQFEQLKERTNESYGQDDVKTRFPKLEDFSSALYTFDIGQNDLHNALISTTEDETRKSIPNLINQFGLAIRKLHQLGARTFWIHNTGPIGCLPIFLATMPSKPDNIDETGSVKSFNEVAKDFNHQLKNKITQLQSELHDSLLIYVDIYSVKDSLITQAKNYGFVDRFGYCCKHNGNPELYCWEKEIVNGTIVYPTPCSNPSEYISWDSVHYTEAANNWIALQILGGSFSDPPIPLMSLCTESRVRLECN